MRNYFLKICVIVLSAGVVFHSCTDDEQGFIETNATEQPKLKVKTISSTEFKETARSLEIKDPQVLRYLEGNLLQLKNLNTDSYVKAIDDSKIIEIEDENTTTFTMRAITDDLNSNTVYTLKETDGEITEQYFKYDDENLEGIEIDPVTSEPIATTMGTCIQTIEVEVLVACTHSSCQDGHEQNGYCQHPTTAVIEAIIRYDCNGAGGGDYIPPSNTDPSYVYGGGLGDDRLSTVNLNFSPIAILAYNFNLTFQEQITLLSLLTDAELAEVTDMILEIGPSTDVQNLVRSFLDGIKTKEEFLQELYEEYTKDNITMDSILPPCIKNIFQEMSGDTNLSDTIITLPLDPTNDDFFQKMLRLFDGENAPKLQFNYSENQDDLGDSVYAITNPSDGVYEILCGPKFKNSSDIEKESTLVHELMHAYMWSKLKEWNFISFNDEGNPILNNNNLDCSNLNSYLIDNDYNGMALFQLPEKIQFRVTLCLFILNENLVNLININIGNDEYLTWSHYLFNENYFDSDLYFDKLSTWIKDFHNWENEANSWKNEMQSEFGDDWKKNVSDVISFVGLNLTEEDAKDFLINYLNYEDIDYEDEVYYINEYLSKLEKIKNNNNDQGYYGKPYFSDCD